MRQGIIPRSEEIDKKKSHPDTVATESVSISEGVTAL